MTSPDNPYAMSGIPRLWRATRILARTLLWSFRQEEALRLELLALALLLPVALYLGQSGTERALLVAPLFLLFIVELLNTALEKTVDRIGLERHQFSGLAKDLGSSAVGVTLIWAVVTWCLVLL